MPKLIIAEQLANRALATSTQPGLNLPVEVLERIIEFRVEDDRKQKPTENPRMRIPLSLLRASRLTYRLAVPHVYSRVFLFEVKNYRSFLINANIESYKHVKEVVMYAVCLGSVTSLRAEATAVRSLEKRAKAYLRTIEKAYGPPTKGVFPVNVTFELAPIANPRYQWMGRNDAEGLQDGLLHGTP